MKDADEVFDLASLAVVHDEAHAFDAVVPPIVQTSLFTFSSYAEMEETYRGLKVRPTYSRGLKDRKSTRLNSSHSQISYAVFCLKKKKKKEKKKIVTIKH